MQKIRKNQRNSQKRKCIKIVKEETKGITLIALVVTIVILIILAGISIGILTGENGLLEKARKCQRASRNSK